MTALNAVQPSSNERLDMRDAGEVMGSFCLVD